VHYFQYAHGELFAEDIPVSELVQRYGTPLYVYSAKTLRRHFQAFDSAFESADHLTCYSVKANSNMHLLGLLGEMGAGMDIVSGGELYRALQAGIPASKIVYSGVGKRDHEINVESTQELRRINDIARALGRRARVSLRINPDVDPKTHPYISTGLQKNKFGLDMESALKTYEMAMEMEAIDPVGIDCHIGSQLTSIDPFLEALDRLMRFNDKLTAMGLHIRFLDLGGGLGITYDEEEPPHPAAFGQALTQALKGRELTLILEPGRVIAGNSGILVTKVLYTKATKTKNFVIVDAAMNDLVRPSLYKSFHRIMEAAPKGRERMVVDVVGPICESGDFLAQDRELPRVEQDELLAVFSAGAYGFSMSSQYNSRPRAAEIIVEGSEVILARRRETYEDLVGPERTR
jgi:diaminopimelate decarboxylase